MLVLLAVKIVDENLLTGMDSVLRRFLTDFNSKFKLGEVVHGPGSLRFYGNNIIQEEHFSVSIHSDDKLQSLEPYPLSRTRRRQIDERMDNVEKKAFLFLSLNASIGCLDITAAPFCSLYASYLQQKISPCRVSALGLQYRALGTLKKHGTQMKYSPQSTKEKSDIAIVSFVDASHSNASSHLLR